MTEPEPTEPEVDDAPPTCAVPDCTAPSVYCHVVVGQRPASCPLDIPWPGDVPLCPRHHEILWVWSFPIRAFQGVL